MQCGGMIAVDTNVLVCLLTGDDPAQQAAARSLFKNERIWIAKTVLLETAWALTSLYGFEESEVSSALLKLLGLARVEAEDAPGIASALALMEEELEFLMPCTLPVGRLVLPSPLSTNHSRGAQLALA